MGLIVKSTCAALQFVTLPFMAVEGVLSGNSEQFSSVANSLCSNVADIAQEVSKLKEERAKHE